MLAAAVDQGRHRSRVDYVDASTDQGKSLFRQIDDLGRLRDATVEPRLHRVTFGRRNIGWSRRHQRSHVAVHNRLGHVIAGYRTQRDPS
jgi:hypothetical protein